MKNSYIIKYLLHILILVSTHFINKLPIFNFLSQKIFSYPSIPYLFVAHFHGNFPQTAPAFHTRQRGKSSIFRQHTHTHTHASPPTRFTHVHPQEEEPENKTGKAARAGWGKRALHRSAPLSLPP